MLYELFLFGLLSGITTWLFGFGGGFVAVPLLYTVIIQKWSNESSVGIHAMQIAVATSAFVMLCSASFATFRHYRSGHIDWQQIRFLWGGIALGGIVGAVMASLFNGYKVVLQQKGADGAWHNIDGGSSTGLLNIGLLGNGGIG
ncbi:sulfite exporter TauE/SafE family protein, partial [Acinetobacter baumannii]|uniref:sulfite exporter TauE/SafE family protein n=1 Tax=Acinetobacter baumannii TaxID=470 RepID=UPI001CB81428